MSDPIVFFFIVVNCGRQKIERRIIAIASVTDILFSFQQFVDDRDRDTPRELTLPRIALLTPYREMLPSFRA